MIVRWLVTRFFPLVLWATYTCRVLSQARVTSLRSGNPDASVERDFQSWSTMSRVRGWSPPINCTLISWSNFTQVGFTWWNTQSHWFCSSTIVVLSYNYPNKCSFYNESYIFSVTFLWQSYSRDHFLKNKLFLTNFKCSSLLHSCAVVLEFLTTHLNL